MEIKKSCGIKGKRTQERIDSSEIDEAFVVKFPFTDLQRKIIEVVYYMRAIKTSQLMDIIGTSSYAYMCKQLLKLYLNGFIDRRFPKTEDNQKGSNEAFYMLDEAGAIYISGALDIPLKDVKWKLRDNLIKPEKLEHTFAICSVRAMLEKEARLLKHKVIHCLGDRHIHTSFEYEGERYEFRPDMYIKYSDGKYRYEFLFEIDMGTMSIVGNSVKTNSVDRKVPYYEYFKLSEIYKHFYEVFPRVIVITTSTDRAARLAKAIKAKQKTKVEFLFTTFDLWRENSVLKPIFIDVDGNFKSLLQS